MQPAEYVRQTKTWPTWLGRTGTVLAATEIRVAAPEKAFLTPYSFALVDFGSEKHSFMGGGQQALQAGDVVQCVLRKTGRGTPAGLIEYGIKVVKITVSPTTHATTTKSV